MAGWRLVDGRAPADEADAFPSVAITSASQLRDELTRLQQQEPAIISLESPRGMALQLGIGGDWAGIRYYPAPRDSVRHSIILADPPCCSRRIDFAAEEDSIAFFPESLIPVTEAIDIAVYFYTHQQLPDALAWKEWDPSSRQWRTHRRAALSS